MRVWLIASIALYGCRVSDVTFTEGDRGGFVWIRSLSTMLPAGVQSGAGGITVTGILNSTADLGGPLLTSAGGSDMVIASFAEASAEHLYSVRYGTGENEYAFIDTVDASGAAFVHGPSFGAADLGQGQVSMHGGGSTDGYVGRYVAGIAGWIARAAGPRDDKIVTTALGGGSTIYAGGWFDQMTTFGGASLTSVGGRDCLLTRFHTFTGAPELVKQYGETGRDEISGIAYGGSSLVVVGMFDSTFTFGGTAAPITATGGGVDLFVAKLAPDGTGVWATSFGGAGDDLDGRITLDRAGDIYIAGTFADRIVIGATTLMSAGGTDHFVAKLRGDGTVVWATSFGSAGNELAGRIAVDDAGHVAFSGAVLGSLDGGPTNGGADAVIAMLDATDGSLAWRHVYSTSGDDRAAAVAFGQSGDLLVVVQLGASYDFNYAVIGAPGAPGALLRMTP